MANFDFVKNIVEQKLLSLHTCYLGKVISVSDDLTTAKIQPLGKTKAYGEEAVTQSVLSNVPIVNSARYCIDTDPHTSNVTIAELCQFGSSAKLTVNAQQMGRMLAIVRKLKAGDIVVCVCAERNISDAKKGINSTPPVGHHSMSDSIIVGVL